MCETGLIDSIYDTEIFDDSFIVYRSDRSSLSSHKTRKGGVLIAVHSSFQSSLLKSGYNDGLEQIWVSIKLFEKTTHIGALYIVPQADFSLYQSHMDFALNIISTMGDCDTCYVAGDFNLPNLQWNKDEENNSHLLPLNITTDIESCVVDGLYSLDLLQINDVRNDNGRILDLFFTNNYNDSTVQIASHRLLPDETHHKALEISITNVKYLINGTPTHSTKLTFNFRRIDYFNMNAFLNDVDWEGAFGNANIEENVKLFYDIIDEGLNLHAPLSTQFHKGTRIPWENKLVKNLKHKKKKAHQNYVKSNRSHTSFALFSNIRRLYNQAANKAKSNYMSKTEHSLKSFFRFVNERRKTGSIPTMMQFNSKQANNTIDIANLFADFFGSVYSTSPQNVDTPAIVTISNLNDSLHIPRFVFTDADIASALQKLDSSFDSGPDGLPQAFLKSCAHTLALPLKILFNKSLASTTFPSLWKISFVRPLYKNGSRSDISNYRGIAKLSAIPKLFESIICKHIYFHCQSVIPDAQHGFVRSKSTTSNLIEFASFVYEAFDERSQVDTFYADISKAFDRIDHKLLCQKLYLFGFPPYWIEWIRSYLIGRTQMISVNEAFSNELPACSGVPQGSHLGPLLFILFISDIGLVIKHCRYMLYADDLKLFIKINSPEDCLNMQEDINSVCAWGLRNKLPLNIKKCYTYSFFRCSVQVQFEYTINGSNLSRPDLILDLGVTFDQKLSFIPHINRVIAKAYAMLGFVIRCSREFKDPDTLKALLLSGLLYPRICVSAMVTFICNPYKKAGIYSKKDSFYLHFAVYSCECIIPSCPHIIVDYYC